jgi:hypothetical protein
MYSSCNEHEQELSGTKWKLDGVVTVNGNTQILESKSDLCYSLKFNESNELSGFSSANQLHGTYEIVSTNKIHIDIHAITEINELFDGRLYINFLNDVQSYSFKRNCLCLYFESGKKYLLFIPVKG